MNIAIDLTALHDNFTGIERYALNMSLAILKLDHRDTFELIFKDEIFPDFLEWKDEKRIRYHVLKSCNKLLFNQWRLPRFLNKLSADRYLFFAFPMPVLLRKKGVFGTIHDMGCWDCPETMKKEMVWYFRLSYLYMAKRASRIITISDFSKGRIQKILGVKEDKILIAQCGISESFISRDQFSHQYLNDVKGKYDLPDSYYLCLSTLEPRKNLMLLLRAYMELYQEGKIKDKLVLAGRKGWKIEQLLDDVRDNGQVIVTGFIEEQDLPAVYHLAKCFVFPSLYEGFGIPPLEAMSQRVPVISSDSSSLPEVLGDAAIYFKNQDKADLRSVLESFELGMFDALDQKVEEGYQRSRKYRYEEEAGKILKSACHNTSGLL